MADHDQDKPKSLFIKINGTTLGQPGTLEGLRCARGFAADGRWRVTIEICAESVEHFIEFSDQFRAPGFTSVEELAGLVRIIVAMNNTSPNPAIPDWIQPVTPDEVLQLGLTADVVMMF